MTLRILVVCFQRLQSTYVKFRFRKAPLILDETYDALEENEDEDSDNRDKQGCDENVLIRILMSETNDTQQRDNCTIMRHRVHST